MTNDAPKTAPTAVEAYEPLTGRWSRLIAPQFVEWLDVPSGGRWLDVGCGTGALIQAILDTQRPSEIVGIDPNSSFIAYARRQITDPRVRYEVGDARELPVPSRQYDAVVAGLVLNHIDPPSLPRAIAEMSRPARRGGVVGAYVWNYASGMGPRVKFWEEATALDPGAVARDERTLYPLCEPRALERMFGRAGFGAVETRSFATDARFSSFDDFWRPFLDGAGVASRYLLALAPDRQAALRERLRQSLPTAQNGEISLSIEAWGVQGVT
ncbi:MAG: class I SAM-dependent methyltransferase [Thermomicrobiales bacterium]